MVGTIGPVVHGHRSRGRRGAILTTYVLSHVTGAAVVGAGLSFLGGAMTQLFSPNSTLVVLGIGLLTALMSLRELNLIPLPIPQRCWQVPRYWSKRPALVMAAGYGLTLGTGVLTFVNSSALYAALAACLLLGDVVAGAAAMAIFGLARSLSVLIATRGYVHASDRSAYLMRLTNAIPLVARLNAAILAAVAGFLIGASRLAASS